MWDEYVGIVILFSLLLRTFENCHLKIFLKLIKRMFLLCDTQFIPRQHTWMESGKKKKKKESSDGSKNLQNYGINKRCLLYIFWNNIEWKKLFAAAFNSNGIFATYPSRARLKHCENTVEVLGSDNLRFKKALTLTLVWVMTLSNHLTSLWHGILFYQRD